MVKLPSLDELKKMGADLMNSAKSIKVDGVVEKIKTQVENLSTRMEGANAVKSAFDRVNAGLDELLKLCPEKTEAFKQIQNDIKVLQEAIESETKKEDKTS